MRFDSFLSMTVSLFEPRDYPNVAKVEDAVPMKSGYHRLSRLATPKLQRRREGKQHGVFLVWLDFTAGDIQNASQKHRKTLLFLAILAFPHFPTCCLRNSRDYLLQFFISRFSGHQLILQMPQKQKGSYDDNNRVISLEYQYSLATRLSMGLEDEIREMEGRVVG
jgi:hypothetical protein